MLAFWVIYPYDKRIEEFSRFSIPYNLFISLQMQNSYLILDEYVSQCIANRQIYVLLS